MFHTTVLIQQHNTTQTSMPPAGLEPTIPASERPQTYALDRAATGIGFRTHNPSKRAAVDPRLRPRDHWDRQERSLSKLYSIITNVTCTCSCF